MARLIERQEIAGQKSRRLPATTCGLQPQLVQLFLPLVFKLVLDFCRQVPECGAIGRCEDFLAAAARHGKNGARLGDPVCLRKRAAKDKGAVGAEYPASVPPAGAIHFAQARNYQAQEQM